MVLVAMALALVLAGIFAEERRQARVGCRIYADGELVYESAGRQLEDVFVSLDRELSGVRQITIEYVGRDGTTVLEFPQVHLDLDGE